MQKALLLSQVDLTKKKLDTKNELGTIQCSEIPPPQTELATVNTPELKVTPSTPIWHLKKDTVERWCWGQPLTPEGCEKAINIGKSFLPTYALRDVSGQGKLPFRNKTCSIPITDDTRWIFEICTKVILDMNEKFFEFDLLYINDLQFVVYDEMGDFHDKHLDMQYECSGIRKLSFVIQLSDPATYNGSELQLHYDKDVVVCKKDQGTMSLYPSYSLNETTTLYGGKRYALMGWVVGPKFK